jgi:hypothetical protein
LPEFTAWRQQIFVRVADLILYLFTTGRVLEFFLSISQQHASNFVLITISRWKKIREIIILMPSSKYNERDATSKEPCVNCTDNRCPCVSVTDKERSTLLRTYTKFAGVKQRILANQANLFYIKSVPTLNVVAF